MRTMDAHGLMILVFLSVLGACGLGSDPRSNATATEPAAAAWKAFQDGNFAWKASGPLVAPDARAADPAVSVKDPTIVRYRDRWHMFCTVRLASGKVDIVYLSFADWNEADRAPRHLLKLHDQYYCAPQVFYFRPHERWYLIYQMADKNHQPPFGPACSTSTELGNPTSWSKPRWLFPVGSQKRNWLDFWVICDRTKAHLFYTSLDGRMWRAETKLADFPGGWSEPQVALTADLFEASHTYKLRGIEKYLTIVEAQGDRRRYYKAYLADRLEGPWKGLADSRSQPFAAVSNVEQENEWTTNISHGELLRAGVDETLAVDPVDVRMVFQGASDAEYRGNPYGKIPWRLGILEMRKWACPKTSEVLETSEAFPLLSASPASVRIRCRNHLETWKSERTIPVDVKVLAVVGVFAIVLLGLLVWGAKNPLIWWLLCVIGTGTGAGLLVWGLLMFHQEDRLAVGSPAGIVGAGAGVLAGSVVLFVAAIVGTCCRRRQQP